MTDRTEKFTEQTLNVATPSDESSEEGTAFNPTFGLRNIVLLGGTSPATKKILIDVLRMLANLIEGNKKESAVQMLLDDKSQDYEMKDYCQQCSHRSTCSEPCAFVDELLPGIHKGRGTRENLTGFYPECLEEIERDRRSDLFAWYKEHEDLFSQKQWLVIYLYYKCSYSEVEIARRMGIARSTVSDLLNRAKKRKRCEEKEIRKEISKCLEEKNT